MGKITGFMEYQRLQEASEAPQKRLKNWREFVLHLNDDQAKQQAARCMDCGIPFCNNGCPVNNIIPDWNDLVYRQEWRRALDVLHSTNNFPAHRPPQGGPPRRVPGGAEPAGSGPEGERRTISAGRPDELRMTTQRPVGPRGSDRRRPARGWCPPRSPPGAGAEPHRQSGRRSPIRRGRRDDDRP
jgi:hypothetical protein